MEAISHNYELNVDPSTWANYTSGGLTGSDGGDTLWMRILFDRLVPAGVELI